ncbi:hypothetical protein [Bordetella ansorpii]|uniref:hypothetical protein n=1 Tax=Bordetella ansorpii TaxID=288768 RepID=UPI0012E98FC6|nr:hypothetical protein [Bordetella ansorpii]
MRPGIRPAGTWPAGRESDYDEGVVEPPEPPVPPVPPAGAGELGAGVVGAGVDGAGLLVDGAGVLLAGGAASSLFLQALSETAATMAAARISDLRIIMSNSSLIEIYGP